MPADNRRAPFCPFHSSPASIRRSCQTVIQFSRCRSARCSIRASRSFSSLWLYEMKTSIGVLSEAAILIEKITPSEPWGGIAADRSPPKDPGEAALRLLDAGRRADANAPAARAEAPAARPRRRRTEMSTKPGIYVFALRVPRRTIRTRPHESCGSRSTRISTTQTLSRTCSRRALSSGSVSRLDPLLQQSGW